MKRISGIKCHLPIAILNMKKFAMEAKASILMGKDVVFLMTLSFNVRNNVIKEIVKFDDDSR